jgi:alpha-N-arabinofuranosidase
MSTVSMIVERQFALARIDDRLYSSFIEHLGRAVYSGIYEPGHPSADAQGFRGDVIELVRELGVSLVRYPGGNFLSGYNWTDGIGPVDRRPRRLDLAWRTIEPNLIGIDEFYEWSKKAGTGIMAAVNMGTGSPKEAGEMLEYCNFPGGTQWSDLRKKNGHADPYGIKTWCIGNEMDGPWQICHLDAVDYGKKARETAKIMKLIDDGLELVVCGSSTSTMPTYPEWDRIVLEHTYENVDYLSLHRYYENLGNRRDFLASFVDMDRFIKSVASTVDYVKSLKRSPKTIGLSFDEWNVWYQQKQIRFDWEEAPPILEDQYSLLDALTFAGMALTLINNSDRVKVACLAQLVNVIAPIFTKKGGGVIRQSTCYPFRDVSRYGRGTALRAVVASPTVETVYGDAPVLHTAAVDDPESSTLTVFCLSIDEKEGHDLDLDLRSFGKVTMILREEMSGSDPDAVNTFDSPDLVRPVSLEPAKGPCERCAVRIRPLSWNVLRFKYSN